MVSKKIKMMYKCSACLSIQTKWMGQCSDCLAYNTLEEYQAPSTSSAHALSHYAAENTFGLIPYHEIAAQTMTRFSSQNPELDRVLGGGFVPGSVCILSGDPGIGKSTLMLQIVDAISASLKTCYLSGEESLSQIRLRGDRLGIKGLFSLGSETQIDSILQLLQNYQPKFFVIDSIQTLYSEKIDSAPGSLNQVRFCAQLLTRYAKSNQATLLLIGHVNKEGALAGPKVFEHLVDTVLSLESDEQGRYRLLRTLKNRFGTVNELGILAMTKDGLKAVSQPSALFRSWHTTAVSGTTLTVLWEGSRPLIVEIQALVADAPGFQGRRVVVGFELSRLNLLLAIVSRIDDWPLHRYDVFVNIVSGLKVSEPSADCAVLAAVYSSFKNLAIPQEWLILGEVGLGGELRPIQYVQERISEAIKHGYKKIFIPKGNQSGLKELIAHNTVLLFGCLKDLFVYIKDHAQPL